MSDIVWGSVADWASGLGSLSASVVALYIAYDSRKIRLEGYVGLRTMIGAGIPSQELFTVAATNVSQRSTVVTNIGLSMGLFFWKRHAIITFMQSPYSHGIPKPLADGERGSWSVDLDDDESWVADLVKKFNMNWLDVQTLRFYVHTSNGGSTKLAPENSLRQMIMKHISKAKRHDP